jgi:hypothetical protein
MGKHNKRSYERYNNSSNVHHLIARSRGWSGNPDNLITLNRRVHNCIHEIFWNKTWVEIIDTVVNGLYANVFREDFKNRINAILESTENPYKSNCFKWRITNNHVRWEADHVELNDDIELGEDIPSEQDIFKEGESEVEVAQITTEDLVEMILDLKESVDAINAHLFAKVDVFQD